MTNTSRLVYIMIHVLKKLLNILEFSKSNLHESNITRFDAKKK